MLVDFYSTENVSFPDFQFSFPRESSFPRQIPGSEVSYCKHWVWDFILQQITMPFHMGEVLRFVVIFCQVRLNVSPVCAVVASPLCGSWSYTELMRNCQPALCVCELWTTVHLCSLQALSSEGFVVLVVLYIVQVRVRFPLLLRLPGLVSVLNQSDFLVAMVSSTDTEALSSKEMAEFCFENANVKSICYCKQRMKSTLPLSSECVKVKHCKSVHIFHLTPTQLVWNGVV